MNRMRINYLDGLRGIAILLVIFYHAFSRWETILPYGDNYASFPLFEYGYLGVQLFFLISGFVIYMSLDKCASLPTFVYKRWLRLFPAMLVCSVLIYFTLPFFTERPNGMQPASDLIPGLVFLDPFTLLKITGAELRSIESAFWSIYVEFKFYILAALVYFTIGRKYLIPFLSLCFTIWLMVDIANELSLHPIFSKLETITAIMGFKHFGWFASGAAYYEYKKNNESKWLYIGALLSIFSAIGLNLTFSMTLAAYMLVALFFFLAITNHFIQSLLANRFLLFTGFISYPLYLIHENMMISLIIQLNQHFPELPAVVFFFVAVAFIMLAAWLIAKYLEPQTKNAIVKTQSLVNKRHSTANT